MTNIKKAIITAVCISMCVVLPMAFHSIPMGGRIFLPIHIPVLICGLICGWPFGLLCGLAGPLLSYLLTSMPSIGDLPSMMVELAIYGVTAALMLKFVHTKKVFADLYISLLTAMLLGRLVTGVVRTYIFAPGSYTMAIWASAYFVESFPGMVIQVVLVPLVVVSLMNARLIPNRYPKGEANG